MSMNERLKQVNEAQDSTYESPFSMKARIGKYLFFHHLDGDLPADAESVQPVAIAGAAMFRNHDLGTSLCRRLRADHDALERHP